MAQSGEQSGETKRKKKGEESPTEKIKKEESISPISWTRQNAGRVTDKGEGGDVTRRMSPGMTVHGRALSPAGSSDKNESSGSSSSSVNRTQQLGARPGMDNMRGGSGGGLFAATPTLQHEGRETRSRPDVNAEAITEIALKEMESPG